MSHGLHKSTFITDMQIRSPKRISKSVAFEMLPCIILNKALTLEYWTSKEYQMHRRINERARMQSQYRAKTGFTAGVLINALLYRISDHADQLLIRR